MRTTGEASGDLRKCTPSWGNGGDLIEEVAFELSLGGSLSFRHCKWREGLRALGWDITREECGFSGAGERIRDGGMRLDRQARAAWGGGP